MYDTQQDYFRIFLLLSIAVPGMLLLFRDIYRLFSGYWIMEAEQERNTLQNGDDETDRRNDRKQQDFNHEHAQSGTQNSSHRRARVPTIRRAADPPLFD